MSNKNKRNLNDIFTEDFGLRSLGFFRKFAKNESELKEIQRAAVLNHEKIMDTPFVHDLIKQAKIDAQISYAGTLRMQIFDKQTELNSIEELIQSEREKSELRNSLESKKSVELSEESIEKELFEISKLSDAIFEDNYDSFADLTASTAKENESQSFEKSTNNSSLDTDLTASTAKENESQSFEKSTNNSSLDMPELPKKTEKRKVPPPLGLKKDENKRTSSQRRNIPSKKVTSTILSHQQLACENEPLGDEVLETESVEDEKLQSALLDNVFLQLKNETEE